MYKIIIILLFFPFVSFSQLDFNDRVGELYKNRKSLIFTFSSGFWDGAADAISFNYEETFFANPFFNDQFFNPKISWQNKWKDGDKLKGERWLTSSNLTVFLTDYWHLSKTKRNLSITFSLLEYRRHNNKIDYLIALIAHTFIRSIGWHTSNFLIRIRWILFFNH